MSTPISTIPCPKCGAQIKEFHVKGESKNSGKTYHCNNDHIDICEHMLKATSKDASNFSCIDCEDNVQDCNCFDCIGGVFCDECQCIVNISCPDVMDILNKNDEKTSKTISAPMEKQSTCQTTLKDPN